ncbi:sigma 54-interacting transcriptional regulator [Paenibacillus sp. BSR1-1]|uniref:sigma-54 interaction domain-containing protein n=1 Tax=Paenibacillus sp. BSR1-1 TaxID=3020845 RepID=UPI0025B240B9|nr:sigma 54-interacting transcriptional regulator [Paenibacillus sp. BSR1-1]MDN3015510.1 sigma 54-interacting transcriptional regulator [Paenibacillus sp. BSR1-1]
METEIDYKKIFDAYPVKVELLPDNMNQRNCPILNKVIQTGMDMFVKNKLEHTCESCSIKEYFQTDTFMIKAIFQERKVVGVLVAAALEGYESWLIENENQLDVRLDFCREWICNTLEINQLRHTNHSILEEVNGIFSFIEEPVLIVGLDGTIHNVSNRVCLEFNKVRSVLIGENISDILSQDDWKKMKTSKKQQEWKISCLLPSGKLKAFTAMVKPLLADGIFVSYLIRLTPVKDLKKKISEQRVLYSFHDIKGTSVPIQNVVDIAIRIAPSDTTVIVRGESGTGKEVFAQAIHQASYRKDGPFIPLNCAAIPESLLESELFGHVKGAFTGATSDKAGRFELADGGTIFLDEIGDLPFPLQAKLLRVVQERKIERVGDTKSTPVNVRIITATHRNLEDLVARGDFREDLYYRLNVIPIMIPPIRERREDIPILIDFYLNKFSKEQFRSPKRISPEVFERLLAYSWPGNVRELQNVVYHFVQLEIGELVTVESLPDYLRTTAKIGAVNEDENPLPRRTDRKLDEKEKIIELLDQYGRGTAAKKKVAIHLNISLPTLYRKINKYKIK